MKRAVSGLVGLVAGVVVLGVVPASYAKPSAPTPLKRVLPPAVNAPANAVAGFYKPSAAGNDTTAYAGDNKAGATLTCVTSSQPDKSYAVAVANGKAYCKLLNTFTYTAPVLCPGTGAQLVLDDKLPADLQATAAKADMCLKANAPAGAASSYVAAICGSNSTGSGFSRVAKPGADTCEKQMSWLTLQVPGAAAGHAVVTCSTVVHSAQNPPRDPVATPAQIDSSSVRCPAGSTLELEGNGVLCKRS
jgi:hypothetical protein